MKEPPADVLGIRLNMSRKVVHRRVRKIGRLEREERGRQEIWTLEREPRFASLLIGYDKDYQVRYVTAIARKGGRRMLYSDVASIKNAFAENTTGYYKYTWESKPRGNAPGYFVIVMGREPQYLMSLSIKKKD
jgi:hypothetical protein